MAAAVKLGVSQMRLEREYYMVDLPGILLEKDRSTAEQRLIMLRLMHPPTEEAEYRKMIDQLASPLANQQAGEPGDELDRKALQALRSRLAGR